MSMLHAPINGRGREAALGLGTSPLVFAVLAALFGPTATAQAQAPLPNLPNWFTAELEGANFVVDSARPATQRVTFIIDRGLALTAHRGAEATGRPTTIELRLEPRGRGAPIDAELFPAARNTPGVERRPPRTNDRFAGGGRDGPSVVQVDVARACPQQRLCRLVFEARLRSQAGQRVRASVRLRASVTGPTDAMPRNLVARGARTVRTVTRVGPLPRPSPPTPAPVAPPPPPPPSDIHACTEDSECVTTCDIPGNCCADQCRTECPFAVNRLALPMLRERRRTECAGHRCPAVGCAPDSTFIPTRCEEGQCVVVRRPRRPR